MKPSNKTTVMQLIKHFKTGHWTCITMRDPVQLGEYGRREIYSWEGMPLFQLDIRFNPPETKAFVIENCSDVECVGEIEVGTPGNTGMIELCRELIDAGSEGKTL